jgi:hypothetical protein
MSRLYLKASAAVHRRLPRGDARKRRLEYRLAAKRSFVQNSANEANPGIRPPRFLYAASKRPYFDTKEHYVSSDPNSPRFPSEALDAFLDGILVELRAPADPAALDEVRAAFRRRIPFSLRSYAAAAMILRAAGLSKPTGKPETRPAPRGDQRPAKEGPAKGKNAESERKKTQGKPSEEKRRKDEPRPAQAKETGGRADSLSRPRFTGEGTTIFLSMGKRQRFYPRILIDLIVERAGLGLEEIGDVRSFDNYSFVDVDPAKAAALVSALDGCEFRGRKLSANPAKKRDGETPSN